VHRCERRGVRDPSGFSSEHFAVSGAQAPLNAWVCEALPFPGLKFLAPDDLGELVPGITCVYQEPSELLRTSTDVAETLLKTLEFLLSL
jgi:hypothetical protein